MPCLIRQVLSGAVGYPGEHSPGVGHRRAAHHAACHVHYEPQYQLVLCRRPRLQRLQVCRVSFSWRRWCDGCLTGRAAVGLSVTGQVWHVDWKHRDAGSSMVCIRLFLISNDVKSSMVVVMVALSAVGLLLLIYVVV